MHHHWQDIVLATSILGFDIALVPSVLGKSKPALGASLMTVIFQLSALVVYLSLSLWFSAITGGLNGLLWLVLAVQKYQQQRQKSYT